MEKDFFDSSVFALNDEQVRALIPYLWLSLGMACATIFAGLRGRRVFGQILGVIFFGGYAALLAFKLSAGSVMVFGTSLEIDPLAKIIGAAVGLFALLATLFSYDDEGKGRHSEWLLLLMTSVMGLSLLPAARDFVALFVYLEVLAISGYILAGLDTRRSPSLEASIKYLLMGAFSSGLLLMGIALIYGHAGTLDFEGVFASVSESQGKDVSLAIAGSLLIVTSLLFKVALFPLHMWSPDVYQAAPTPYAAFLATATKLSVFGTLAVVLNRAGLLHVPGVKNTIEVLAVLSVVAGSCLALAQRSLRRMFAYSGIVNAGYAALGVAVGASATGSVITNLIIYGASLIGVYAVIQHFLGKLGYSLNADCEVQDLQLAAKRSSPIVLGLFAFAVFSISGIPPLPGFFGKYLLLRDLWMGGSQIGAWSLLFGTLLGLAYYLKLFVPIYMDEGKAGVENSAMSARIRTASYAAAILALVLSVVILGGLNRLPQWLHSVDALAR